MRKFSVVEVCKVDEREVEVARTRWFFRLPQKPFQTDIRNEHMSRMMLIIAGIVGLRLASK